MALSDLITTITQGTYFTRIMARHATNNVPTASWLGILNLGYSTTQVTAEMLSEMRGEVTNLARSMFLDYAASIGLSLYARGQFQLDRQPAQFAKGLMVLSGTVGAPSYSFAPGGVVVGSRGRNALLYTSLDAGRLAPGSCYLGGANGLQVQQKSLGISVEFIAPNPNGTLTVIGGGHGVLVLLGSDNLGNPTSTATSVAAAINATPSASALVSATAQGDGSSVLPMVEALPLDGGWCAMTFQAQQPGAIYNLPTNSVLDLKTSFAGVTVSNPTMGPLLTWLFVQGANVEADDRLKLRCVDRWSTTGAGASDDALTFWALATPAGYLSSPVTRARVLSNYLNGVAAGGAATVVLIGPTGALSPTDVAAVAANFENPQKYSQGMILAVISATNRTIPIGGTVNVFRKFGAQLADVQGAVQLAIAQYQLTLDAGQTIYTQTEVAGIIGQAPPFASAIRNVDLGGLAPVIPLGYLEYPVLDVSSLNYVLVDA